MKLGPVAGRCGHDSDPSGSMEAGEFRYEVSDYQFLQASVPQTFSPATHPNLPKTHDGTPQNIASQKRGTKLHMVLNMYVDINPCSIRMQAYENKT
jgi:hypothetical protein